MGRGPGLRHSAFYANAAHPLQQQAQDTEEQRPQATHDTEAETNDEGSRDERDEGDTDRSQKEGFTATVRGNGPARESGQAIVQEAASQRHAAAGVGP